MQSEVGVCRDAQLFDPYLVASGGCSFTPGAYSKQEVSRFFGYHRHVFSSLWPALGVELHDSLPIRSCDPHN
jgi:hypothetical protein